METGGLSESRPRHRLKWCVEGEGVPNHPAKTQPPHESGSGLELEDLVDVGTLQAIQDAFARATGVASIITRPDGRPITRPSCFCRLCSEIIRATPKGLANCIASDAIIGRSDPDGPTIQHCLSGGLWDGGASITVGDRHLANWLVGQVLDETVDQDRMMAYAREIGADEDDFRGALAEVTRMPLAQFEEVCHALFLIANQLSTLAYHNSELRQEIRERKRAETRLNQANEELSAANEEITAADEELRQQFELLQETQRELVESEGRFREMLENARLAAVILDAEGRITFCNEYLLQLTGWAFDEVVNRSWFDLFLEGEERTRIETAFRQFLSEAQHPFQHNVNDIVTRHGERRTISWNNTPLRDQQHRTVAVAAIGEDITERKRNEEAIHHLAYHDQLTGLPNRALFVDRVTQAIAHARRDLEQLAILFVDIDNFKTINDTLGHDKGDELLRAVGSRLVHRLREEDTIARMGGDEFTALIRDVQSADDASAGARRIMEAIQTPFWIGEQEFQLTASIGIALYPENGEDVVTLQKHADTAMYAAKEAGKGGYQFYTPAMNERLERRSALETRLRRAIANQEFAVYYQPVVSLDSGQVIAMEALLRWHHPERGVILPGEFIPLAEETGLIVPIGEWVLKTACAQNRGWQEAGLPKVRVSVNLSPRQFQQPDLAVTIERILAATKLDSTYLGLEITESATMAETGSAARTLKRLREMGIKIALDDFGTGYSALSYLRRLPIDTVKLDKSFIRDLENDESAAAIAAAVIYLAHHLNLDVVAEGVENRQQLALLHQQGCDAIQGFIHSRPSPPAEAVEFLRVRNS